MGSFPKMIFGDYGDEKVTSSTKIGSLPLGHLMILPDGRKYRHAKSGGTALVVGTIQRQGALGDLVMDQDVLFASSAAIGAEKVSLIMGGTTMVKDYFADGYLYTSLSAGVGSVYKIKSHPAATAAAATIEFTLADNDKLTLAVVAASSKAGFQLNEYGATKLNPAGTAFSGIICGIPPVAVSAGWYYWVQRSGPAVGLAAGTAMVIGEGVSCSSVEAGSLTISSTAGDQAMDIIGHALAVGAASTYVLINLELE